MHAVAAFVIVLQGNAHTGNWIRHTLKLAHRMIVSQCAWLQSYTLIRHTCCELRHIVTHRHTLPHCNRLAHAYAYVCIHIQKLMLTHSTYSMQQTQPCLTAYCRGCNAPMIQALYQALKIIVFLESVPEIQSIKDSTQHEGLLD